MLRHPPLIEASCCGMLTKGSISWCHNVRMSVNSPGYTMPSSTSFLTGLLHGLSIGLENALVASRPFNMFIHVLHSTHFLATVQQEFQSAGFGTLCASNRHCCVGVLNMRVFFWCADGFGCACPCLTSYLKHALILEPRGVDLSVAIPTNHA